MRLRLLFFAITVCWFYGLNYVRGMPDRVGHDDSSGIRVDHFYLFISLLNEASTIQEPLDVGQTVAFLAADG